MPEKCIKDHVASADASVAHQPPNQTKLTKMKSMIVVALALVAIAAAVPVEQPEQVPIVRSEFNQDPEGGYNYGYEAGNGIVREETGEVKEVPDEDNNLHKVVIVRGSYSYPSEDGSPVNIVYYADETGYHAEGDSIPKAASR